MSSDKSPYRDSNLAIILQWPKMCQKVSLKKERQEIVKLWPKSLILSPISKKDCKV